jgi:predicted phosphodiesterase
MTRTAIVSDVHGNAVALRAVLEDLDSEGIGGAVCLGDLCQGGPEPDACVDLVAERGWPVVLGNADAFVLEPTALSGRLPEDQEHPVGSDDRKPEIGHRQGAPRLNSSREPLDDLHLLRPLLPTCYPRSNCFDGERFV